MDAVKTFGYITLALFLTFLLEKVVMAYYLTDLQETKKIGIANGFIFLLILACIAYFVEPEIKPKYTYQPE